MKVAHLFWGLGFGGIETMLVNIANEQCIAGAEVYVMIINKCYEQSLIAALNPKVHLILINRKMKSYSPCFIYRINKELDHIKPDVIHLHRSELKRYVWNKRLSREAFITLHALPTGSVRRCGLLRQLLHKIMRQPQVYSNVIDMDNIKHVYAISNLVKQELQEKYGIESKVICNGILTKRFKQRTAQKMCKPLRIVMVSRLEHDKKGQDLLIQVASELRGQVMVDFIGVGSSMELLQKMSRELQMENYIHFLGKKTQDYVAEHLADYDLFVQPSRWEGFGLTVAEAMAANVPVLVSEGQGPAEVTCGNLYGWLFKNGDATDLANQLSYIASHYEEAMIKAEKAMSYVQNTYDVSVTAQKYLQQYEIIKMNNNVKHQLGGVNSIYIEGRVLVLSSALNTLNPYEASIRFGSYAA